MTTVELWTIVGIALTNMATTVSLFIWASSKTDSYRDENKEFHGRLCTLEERYLQMMQRMLEDRN